MFFAKKMWTAGYVTMLDPFQDRYGGVLTGLLYIAALFAEVSFAAIAFAVLGESSIIKKNTASNIADTGISGNSDWSMHTYLPNNI